MQFITVEFFWNWSKWHLPFSPYPQIQSFYPGSTQVRWDLALLLFLVSCSFMCLEVCPQVSHFMTFTMTQVRVTGLCFLGIGLLRWWVAFSEDDGHFAEHLIFCSLFYSLNSWSTQSFFQSNYTSFLSIPCGANLEWVLAIWFGNQETSSVLSEDTAHKGRTHGDQVFVLHRDMCLNTAGSDCISFRQRKVALISLYSRQKEQITPRCQI